jgi:predicted RNA-binding protein YlqC (UPF0109 family)
MAAMADKQFDQEFVEFIVKSIVDNADDVMTERVVDEMGTLISLHVKADDMATIIGKEGRTAKALRTILRVLGARHNERINLKIIEPEGGRGFFPGEPGEHAEAKPEKPKPIASHKNAITDALSDVPQDEIG